MSCQSLNEGPQLIHSAQTALQQISLVLAAGVALGSGGPPERADCLLTLSRSHFGNGK